MSLVDNVAKLRGFARGFCRVRGAAFRNTRHQIACTLGADGPNQTATMLPRSGGGVIRWLRLIVEASATTAIHQMHGSTPSPRTSI